MYILELNELWVNLLMNKKSSQMPDEPPNFPCMMEDRVGGAFRVGGERLQNIANMTKLRDRTIRLCPANGTDALRKEERPQRSDVFGIK